MKKKAERINVITESNNKNFVHAILNAVTKGYSDSIIVDDILDLLRTNEISRGVLSTTPEALRDYASKFRKSLEFIADEMEGFEIREPGELIVNKKKKENDDENVIQDELEEMKDNDSEKRFVEISERADNIKEKMNEIEEKMCGKKHASKSEIQVIEANFEESSYIENENKLAGTLLINFNQDMSIYKRGNKVVLAKNTTEFVKSAIFSYLKNEYPQLKAVLSDEIFTSNVKFSNLRTGEASINYEISEAF